MNSKIAGTASALFLSILAAGCGGGGSQAAGANDGLPPMAASSITAGNAESVAGQGYATVSTIDEQTGVGTQFLLGVSITAGQISPLKGPLTLLYKHSAESANLVVGATVNCTDGGTVTYTETNTSLAITAYSCLEDGLLMNGSLSLVLSNVIGDPDVDAAWSADMAINFQNFAATENGIGIRINGDMTVDYSQTSSQVIDAIISGQSLHVLYLENGSTVLNSLLKPYSFNVRQNLNTYTSTADFTYASTGSSLGDISYQVATNTAFESTGSAYPHAGSLTVTATDNSTVTLTALDDTNVRLDIDLNGDSTIEETITTTWTDLADAV